MKVTLSIFLAIAALGCTPDMADDDLEPTPVTLSDSSSPQAVEICSGTRDSKTGERCTELYEDEALMSCSHSVSRDINGSGREGDNVDSIHLVLAADGSFVITAESTSNERYNLHGRRIETTSRMFVEYQENADGAGRCTFGDGQWSDCAREDPILLNIGADPCTRDYLLAARTEG